MNVFLKGEHMNKEKLNNVIILNSIPSNLIEEAIFILKPVDMQSKKKIEEYAKLEGRDFVKEYLKNEEKTKKKHKIKRFIFGLTITIFVLLILSLLHIFK